MILQNTLIAGGGDDHPIWSSPIARSNSHMMLGHLESIYSNRKKQKAYQAELVKYVEEAPNDLAQELRQLIADCTQAVPSKRCTIEEAIERFGSLIEKAKADPSKLYDPTLDFPLVA